MASSALTKREIEVVQAVADAGSEAGAAADLGIALQTVKNTTMSVRKKMDAGSTLQAAYWLTLEGVLPIKTKSWDQMVRETGEG